MKNSKEKKFRNFTKSKNNIIQLTRKNCLSFILQKQTKRQYLRKWGHISREENQELVKKTSQFLKKKAQYYGVLSLFRYKVNHIQNRQRYYLKVWQEATHRESSYHNKVIKQHNQGSQALNDIILINSHYELTKNLKFRKLAQPSQDDKIKEKLAKVLDSKLEETYDDCCFEHGKIRKKIFSQNFVELCLDLLSNQNI